MTIPGVNLVTYSLIKQAPSVNCSPLGATIKVASYRKRTLCTLVLIYVTVKYIYDNVESEPVSETLRKRTNADKA